MPEDEQFRRAEDHAMLQRIDERTQNFIMQVAELKSTVHSLRVELDKYVLHVRFSPIERGFYGLAFIIVAAVVSAMVALVVRK